MKPETVSIEIHGIMYEIPRRGRMLRCLSCLKFANFLLVCGCGLLICVACRQSREHRIYTPGGEATEHLS